MITFFSDVFVRYDKLLEAFRRPGQQRTSSVSVVGVTVMNDVMLGAVVNAYHSNTVCPQSTICNKYAIHNSGICILILLIFILCN